MSTAYSTVGDLLLGDITVSDTVDEQRFVDDAADEIDSRLGVLYHLPIDLNALDERAKIQLKRISNWIASGRLILSLDLSSESVSGYASQLVNDALEELRALAGGNPPLIGATSASGTGSSGPAISNHDAVSAVEAFEQQVLNWHPPGTWPPPPVGPPLWQPGH